MGKLDKALMVTSSVAGEGKTLTSLNLAITMAQEFDHTVLLVEADIRKPSFLNTSDWKAEAGLTDCVLDGLDISEVLVKTGIGSLSILPAGRAVDNPVELFSSNRMNAIFDEIKQRYKDRYVIVDTTPLLPFAEPQYIANVSRCRSAGCQGRGHDTGEAEKITGNSQEQQPSGSCLEWCQQGEFLARLLRILRLSIKGEVSIMNLRVALLTLGFFCSGFTLLRRFHIDHLVSICTWNTMTTSISIQITRRMMLSLRSHQTSHRPGRRLA